MLQNHIRFLKFFNRKTFKTKFFTLGEDCGSQTILDSWDASQIVGVNKTQVPGLNETLVEPVLSLKESFAMPKPVISKFTAR